MHRERFQTSSKLEIWPRLISTRRQNGALLRDRFRLRDSKARLSAIKSSRPAERRFSRLAFPFSSSTVRAGKTGGIILALCEEDACWGYFMPVHPRESTVTFCGEACNRFNTTTKIRSTDLRVIFRFKSVSWFIENDFARQRVREIKICSEKQNDHQACTVLLSRRKRGLRVQRN